MADDTTLSRLIFQKTPKEFDKITGHNLQNVQDFRERGLDFANDMDLGGITVFQEEIDISKPTDKWGKYKPGRRAILFVEKDRSKTKKNQNNRLKAKQ